MMDNNAIIDGMKKLKSAIEDFLDNMEMDDAEKGKKKAPKAKAKPEDEDEKDGE